MKNLTDLTKEELIELIVREREALSGWQPIESAPRDGGRFIVYDPSKAFDQIVVGYFTRGEFVASTSGIVLYNPTHWKPLPTPPMGIEE